MAVPVGPQQYLTEYPPCPESVAEARHAIRLILLTWSLEPLCEDAQLVASELVTNAVQHSEKIGMHPVRMSVVRLAKGVEISVHDPSTSRPILTHPSPDAESGRGMHLIDVLCPDWGVDVSSHRGSKRVWARLEL